jgi:ABC-2 type transport system permease protein
MTTITADLVTPAARPHTTGVWRRASDVLVLTGRNLVHIAREPLQLSDVTIQPVLFTLLFV